MFLRCPIWLLSRIYHVVLYICLYKTLQFAKGLCQNVGLVYVRGCSFFTLHTQLGEFFPNRSKCFVPPLRQWKNVSYPFTEHRKMFRTPYFRRCQNVSYPSQFTENVSYPSQFTENVSYPLNPSYASRFNQYVS